MIKNKINVLYFLGCEHLVFNLRGSQTCRSKTVMFNLQKHSFSLKINKKFLPSIPKQSGIIFTPSLL